MRNLEGPQPRLAGGLRAAHQAGAPRVDLSPRYVGFEIPDRFAIGYGLDYAQRYRNLDYVAALAGLRRKTALVR